MDSVTQIALGASIGEATAGREANMKAPLWGGVLGLLPDLDVLADPLLTEAQSLTFHRSVTHSIVFVVLASLCIGWGLKRLHSEMNVTAGRWLLLTGAVLGTHICLDCLTTYGTQIFWPVSRQPVILATIFVIDPFYTIPLTTGLLLALRWPSRARRRRWFNYAGLGLSSLYLLTTIVNKIHVQHTFRAALAQENRPVKQLLTRPTPFNNVLWTGIAEADAGYYVGLYSLLEGHRNIDFQYVPKRHSLLGTAANSPPIRRLRRFSQGYFIIRRNEEGALLFHDLRFGRNDLGLTSEGEYLFTFRLLQDQDGKVVGIRQKEPPIRFNRRLLRRFWAQIWGVPVEGGRAPDPPSAISE